MFFPAPLASLTARDVVWLVPCTLALWAIGIVLALDDSGRFFKGNEPSAPTWAAWGLALGVFGIWRWRRWLIRDELLRPAHDSADDLLWLIGAFGAITLYIAIVPARSLLPPNATLCLLCGLAGARLLHSGLTRRIGNTLHCSRCNYQIVDTSLPRRCPECSGVWAHRLVRGKIVRSTGMISAGCILLFILSLSPVPRFEVSRAFIRRQMTTGWIVSQATQSLNDGVPFDADLWRELGKRALTDPQAQTLADLVLDGGGTRNLRDFGGIAWLENLVFSGKAPRRATDRLMDQSLSFQLTAPATGFPGRSVPISLQALELRRLPRDRIAVYLESLTDDQDPTPIRSGSKWETLGDALLGATATLPPARPRGTPVPATTPLFSDNLGVVAAPFLDLVGPHTLRARVWVAIVPPGAPPTLTPSALVPLYSDPSAKSPVMWLKQVDLRADIEILDRRTRTVPVPSSRGNPGTPPAGPK